jgi:dipeptidase
MNIHKDNAKIQSLQGRSHKQLLLTGKKYNLSYFDTSYGIMNEKGLGIGESTCSARIFAKGCTYEGEREKKKNCANMNINDLSRIALERAETAREAV